MGVAALGQWLKFDPELTASSGNLSEMEILKTHTRLTG